MPKKTTDDIDKPFDLLYRLTIRADGANIITGCCTATMYGRIETALVTGVPLLRLYDSGGEGQNVIVRSANVTAIVFGETCAIGKRSNGLSLFDGFNGITYFDYADGTSTNDADEP